jgi:hypothetical protein
LRPSITNSKAANVPFGVSPWNVRLRLGSHAVLEYTMPIALTAFSLHRIAR